MADDQSDAQTTTASGDGPTGSGTPAERGGSSRRALGLAIVALVALIAVTVGVVLGKSGDSNPVDDVSAALASNATLLAGPLNPTGLQHARCTKSTETTFTCTPVIGNATEKPVRVIWKDGVLTKRLAGTNLTAPPRSGTDVAQTLIADERATIGRALKYGCAFTSGLSPSGEAATGSPGGYRCAAPDPKAKGQYIQRYVEFAPDGSVTRDFMLTGVS